MSHQHCTCTYSTECCCCGNPYPDALRGGTTAPTVEPSPPAPAPQALDWDGWREVSAEEWDAAIVHKDQRGRRVIDFPVGDFRGHTRYFLPVAPIPDAIGMCPNGHVMVRDGDGYWTHLSQPPLPGGCFWSQRTVEVIGTRSRP